MRPQNLLHLLPFGEFVDQLVQPAYLLHQRVFDLLNAYAAESVVHISKSDNKTVDLQRFSDANRSLGAVCGDEPLSLG